MNSKLRMWAAVLGIFFILSGIGKFLYPEMGQLFVAWNYPWWFQYVIGVAQIICGILLFFESTLLLAAIVKSFILAGAVGTHYLAGDYLRSLPASILLLLTVLLAVCWRIANLSNQSRP